MSIEANGARGAVAANLPNLDFLNGLGQQNRTTRGGDTPPPAPPAANDPVDTPVLSMPSGGADMTAILVKALALKMANSDQQTSASMQEVQQNGEIMKSKNDEIAQKLTEAAEKAEKAKGLDGFLKALTWIGVGLAVAVAAVTLNPVAIAGAVAAVSMAVLNETGTMDKMTNAIADSLQKDGMSEGAAKKLAMGITMGIGIAVSIASIAGGAAAGATDVAKSMMSAAGKLGSFATQITTASKVAEVGVGVAQAGTSVAKGTYAYQAADAQADVADAKRFTAKLQAAIDDETDRLSAMLQEATASVSKALATMGRVTDSTQNITRHMA